MQENIRDMGLIPGLGRSPGEGNGNPLQYSCLENPWTEEPGRLQSRGSQRVGHDHSTAHHHLTTTPNKPTTNLILLLLTKPTDFLCLVILTYCMVLKGRGHFLSFLLSLCLVWDKIQEIKGTWVLNGCTSTHGVLVGPGCFLSTLCICSLKFQKNLQ